MFWSVLNLILEIDWSVLNLKVVVRWKNEFKVVLCQILNYWLNCGSYPVSRSFK